jgi:hypothetical protein
MKPLLRVALPVLLIATVGQLPPAAADFQSRVTDQFAYGTYIAEPGDQVVFSIENFHAQPRAAWMYGVDTTPPGSDGATGWWVMGAGYQSNSLTVEARLDSDHRQVGRVTEPADAAYASSAIVYNPVAIAPHSVGRVAFATWGVTGTIVIKVNGVAVSLSQGDPSRAFVASPSEFQSGVSVGLGTGQAAEGTTYSRSSSGHLMSLFLMDSFIGTVTDPQGEQMTWFESPVASGTGFAGPTDGMWTYAITAGADIQSDDGPVVWGIELPV